MANLVSLKRTPSEKKNDMPEAYEPPDYDYGTRIHLDEDALAKLGVGKVEVGDEMMLTARVKVVSYSEGASERHSHRSAEMQLTDAALEPAVDVNRVSDAQAFYGRN